MLCMLCMLCMQLCVLVSKLGNTQTLKSLS
jgi:hypothetical protein